MLNLQNLQHFPTDSWLPVARCDHKPKTLQWQGLYQNPLPQAITGENKLLVKGKYRSSVSKIKKEENPKTELMKWYRHTRSIASCSAGVTLMAWGISWSGWSNISLRRTDYTILWHIRSGWINNLYFCRQKEKRKMISLVNLRIQHMVGLKPKVCHMLAFATKAYDNRPHRHWEN